LWCEPKAGSPKRGSSSARRDGPANLSPYRSNIAPASHHGFSRLVRSVPIPPCRMPARIPEPRVERRTASSGGCTVHCRSLLRRWRPTDRCLPRRFLPPWLPRHQAPLRCVRRRYPVSPVGCLYILAINESPKPCNAKSIRVAKMSRV